MVAAARREAPSARRRHIAAVVLWVVAAGFAIADFLEYIGAVQWLAADVAVIVLGGPMVILALAGAIVYGR